MKTSATFPVQALKRS